MKFNEPHTCIGNVYVIAQHLYMERDGRIPQVSSQPPRPTFTSLTPSDLPQQKY